MRRTAGFFALLLIAAVLPVAAGADVLNAHGGATSQGWYSDQGQLTSTVVPAGSFGQLFSSAVSGQVYAQPVVRNNKLLVATEANDIYAFHPRTGAPIWTRNLGTPWNIADIFACADVAPTVGVTSTPVIDPATNVEYLTAKTYASGTSGPARYTLHAIDVDTGNERTDLGFPRVISGVADNAPSVEFDATSQLQRPGLLLMNGVIYAAFGGLCDRGPYRGWIVGVSASTGQITARWAAQQGIFSGSGFWQSGAPLASDTPGDILAVSGNGHLMLTAPTPGNQPPPDMSEAAMRLRVQPNGTLSVVDFFTPYDAPELDVHDVDFGSGGPVVLPDSFGTPSHPHLMVAVGKAGYIYLLDRNHLGGFRNDGKLADDVVARLGPTGGVWSTPAVWPGDGGYVYINHAAGPAGGYGVYQGHLRAYKRGVDGNGNPLLSFVGQSDEMFGFGGGTAVVTSDGMNPGSALVWVIWQADVTGANAQLRAYDAVPINGHMHLRWSTPIGTATKFQAPAVDGNAVYLGTRDGHVLGFGAPVDQPLSSTPGQLTFDPTTMGQTATKTLTFNATRPVTLSSLTSSVPGVFTVGTPTRPLPTTVDVGNPLTVNVTYAPNAKGLTSAKVTADVAGTDPDVNVGLMGLGRAATGDLDVFPADVTMGGAPVGGSTLTTTATFTNRGALDMKVVGLSLPGPASHFTVTGAPAVGSTMHAGASTTVSVTFTPSVSGFYSGVLRLVTDAASPGTHDLSVRLAASAATPAHLVVDPETTYYGPVRIGTTKVKSVTLRDTGAISMEITKSKPPANGAGFEQIFPPFGEGSSIAAMHAAAVNVAFTATKPGHFADTWTLNGDDDTGLHTLKFDAWAVPPTNAYWMVDKNGRAYGFGNAGSMSTAPTRFNAAAIVPYWSGRGYYVLDEGGTVRTAGDARYYGSMSLSWFRPFERAASMSLTPSGKGYWIFTSMGRVFAFGDARRFGDLSNKRLNGPIISSIATPDGGGYYMVGSDGGVFAFGDAKYLGSTGGRRLNKPVVGILPTETGHGYYLSASDGGVFTFGDARFRGSMGGHHLNQPICGMVRYGNGYLMVASDGGIFNFSNARFVGSLGGRTIPAPIVGVGAFAA